MSFRKKCVFNLYFNFKLDVNKVRKKVVIGKVVYNLLKLKTKKIEKANNISANFFMNSFKKLIMKIFFFVV